MNQSQALSKRYEREGYEMTTHQEMLLMQKNITLGLIALGIFIVIIVVYNIAKKRQKK